MRIGIKCMGIIKFMGHQTSTVKCNKTLRIQMLNIGHKNGLLACSSTTTMMKAYTIIFFMQQSWANNNAIERQRKGSERKNYFSDNVTIIVTFVV